MAISPGIPTSFVPKQPTPDRKRSSSTGRNLFLVVSLLVAVFAIVAGVGTYLYDRYLTHSLEAKAMELASAQREVNEEQVEEFVRLRDRLSYGRDLLNRHIALSQVFEVFEARTLATVRFSTLDLQIAEDGTAQLEIEGTARTFNALAAQSNAFAAEKDIRRAIFSGIVVNGDRTVNFRLTADLDPDLLIANENRALPEVPPPPPAPEEPLIEEVDEAAPETL